MKERQVGRNDIEVLGPEISFIQKGCSGTWKYLAQDFDLIPYITVTENVGKYHLISFRREKSKNSRTP